MGIFDKKHGKKTGATSEADENAQLFYDEYFREELRNHSRWYFEKIINENAALFKKDLDATISEVYSELKGQLSKQFESAFEEYGKAMKDAQAVALNSLTKTAEELEANHKQLGETVEAKIAEQQQMIDEVIEKNKQQLDAMKGVQDQAAESLNNTARALEEQRVSLTETLQKDAEAQKQLLVNAFEENMATVVEHYLVGALGDQYDLKTQLPAILSNLESNKQAIVDDIQL